MHGKTPPIRPCLIRATVCRRIGDRIVDVRQLGPDEMPVIRTEIASRDCPRSSKL